MCIQNDNVCRGCFFCRSGTETEIVQRFRNEFPDSRAIFPTYTRYRRTKDGAFEEHVPLLPGYVFFEMEIVEGTIPSARNGASAQRSMDAEIVLLNFCHTAHVLKLLRYTNQDWRLHGSDDTFAKVLFEAEGNIDTSQAYFDEGDRIRILSGFLKDYEGSITRVNRKNRTVEVCVDLQDKKVTMKLGYELVSAVKETPAT